MPGPEPIDELAALREVSAWKLAEAIKAYERALLGEGSVRASEAEIVRLIAQTITFSRTLPDQDGQVFALIVMVIAACEVVVGLGIIVAAYRRRIPLNVDELRSLRG